MTTEQLDLLALVYEIILNWSDHDPDTDTQTTIEALPITSDRDSSISNREFAIGQPLQMGGEES